MLRFALFPLANSAFSSGVGVDLFCCGRVFFIIVLTAIFESFLSLEIAAFTGTSTSRRINISVIRDRAVSQSDPLTPPINADLVSQLLSIEADRVEP